MVARADENLKVQAKYFEEQMAKEAPDAPHPLELEPQDKPLAP